MVPIISSFCYSCLCVIPHISEHKTWPMTSYNQENMSKVMQCHFCDYIVRDCNFHLSGRFSLFLTGEADEARNWQWHPTNRELGTEALSPIAPKALTAATNHGMSSEADPSTSWAFRWDPPVTAGLGERHYWLGWPTETEIIIVCC